MKLEIKFIYLYQNMYTIVYTIFDKMKIISTREFRDNQKSYFELAERERVIIHRGKNKKPVLLTPIEESSESDLYFSDSDVLESIRRGIEDAKAGRTTRIKDPKDIWGSIL